MANLIPDDDTPDQCYECGSYNVDGDEWHQEERDTDPGDAEVGPQPCLSTVSICPVCRILPVSPETRARERAWDAKHGRTTVAGSLAAVRARRRGLTLTSPGHTPSGRLTLSERYARAKARRRLLSCKGVGR